MLFLMSFSLDSSITLVGDFDGDASSGSPEGSGGAVGRPPPVEGLACPLRLTARRITSDPAAVKNVKNLRLVSNMFPSLPAPCGSLDATCRRASSLFQCYTLPPVKKRCPV